MRIERDSMGEIEVDENVYWGAQTERSRRNFKIGQGKETMPEEIIRAFAVVKAAAARANATLLPEKMTKEKLSAIEAVSREILSGALSAHFHLVVFQTGSGTQSNMNVNEVIANRGNELAGKKLLHPNDDVNMSQSSNDTFPTAMNVAAVLSLTDRLIPAAKKLSACLREKENAYMEVRKCGRTHLQDAVPMTFGQEISGWRESVDTGIRLLEASLEPLYQLALGGTAVGTGLNAPKGFAEDAAREIAKATGKPFVTAENKFHALTSRSEIVFSHGAVKALASDLMKIANDVRWLSSGPRNGLGEITIPANEPGSSIMPGKVNPTQCEQVTMVAVQIFGNDSALSFAASQGNFELNVFLPVIAFNFLQSVRLLSDSMDSFRENCLEGMVPNTEKMRELTDRSLMTVTALSPRIGYENAARVAKKAFEENLSLRDSAVQLKLLSAEECDALLNSRSLYGL